MRSGSRPAPKTWVGYEVVVEADASGALGDEHTFTIDVDRTDGKTSTPAAGVVANFTFTGPAGSLVTEIDGVADPNATSCPTNGAALCTVTVDSDTNVGDGVLTVTSIEGDLVVAGIRAETPGPIPGGSPVGSDRGEHHARRRPAPARDQMCAAGRTSDTPT
jgi:hypothetical protein